MQLDYVTWQPPESLPIVIHRRAMDGIHQDVSDAFAAAPHRGGETGGILLGRREADRIVIEDFEPVPSEHRFGPSYRLSDADCELLDESIRWFRGGSQGGLDVLGFYRSHTAPEFELCDEDRDLLRAHFVAHEDLILLVKPGWRGASESDFWICHGERSEPVVAPPPALMSWPAPRPRLDSDTRRLGSKRRRPIWYGLAIFFGLGAGALGYLWWHPDAGAERAVTDAPSPATPPAASAPAETKPSGSAAREAAPTEPALDSAGIQATIDRWVSALRRGDVEAAAACYAPVVNNYFGKREVSRAAVLQSIRKVRAGNGKLEIYRISHVEIVPGSDGNAFAMFHKKWQWAGRRHISGEENERMTLTHTDAGWRILAEEAQ